MGQRVVVKRPPEEQHGEEMTELAARDTEEQTEADRLLEDTDRLLEDIEDALGENLEFAQEFVMNYVQKGGE